MKMMRKRKLKIIDKVIYSFYRVENIYNLFFKININFLFLEV